MNSDEEIQLIGKLVGLIGDDLFCPLLASVGQDMTGYDSTVIIAYSARQKPILIYNNLSELDESNTLTPYFDGAYLLDPLYSTYRSHASDGIYPIAQIAPEDFFKTEYYQSYYRKTKIVNETGMLVNINDDICISISYGLRESSKPLGSRIENLAKLFPILCACCKQHWSNKNQLAVLKNHITNQGEFGVTLDSAFKNFGKNYLTPRECEVVHLILKGYSSKAISTLLGISLETVKVHCKRFHTKLGVSSHAELFSLFLEAISLVPLGLGNKDPLSYFYEPQ